jgi:hypothetical protein
MVTWIAGGGVVKARGLFAFLFREKPPTRDDSIRGSLEALLKSDKFPDKLESGIGGGPVILRWDNGLIVSARDGRWPRVDVSRNGQLQFTYEYDQPLVDAVMKFAHRAYAARDRSKVVDAIHQLLQ